MKCLSCNRTGPSHLKAEGWRVAALNKVISLEFKIDIIFLPRLEWSKIVQVNCITYTMDQNSIHFLHPPFLSVYMKNINRTLWHIHRSCFLGISVAFFHWWLTMYVCNQLKKRWCPYMLLIVQGFMIGNQLMQGLDIFKRHRPWEASIFFKWLQCV